MSLELNRLKSQLMSLEFRQEKLNREILATKLHISLLLLGIEPTKVKELLNSAANRE